MCKLAYRAHENDEQTLTAVIDAADFLSADWEKLVALVQSRQSSNNDENEFQGHDLSIIDVFTGLLERAQTELDNNHLSESDAAHDFAMLK